MKLLHHSKVMKKMLFVSLEALILTSTVSDPTPKTIKIDMFQTDHSVSATALLPQIKSKPTLGAAICCVPTFRAAQRCLRLCKSTTVSGWSSWVPGIIIILRPAMVIYVVYYSKLIFATKFTCH